MKSLAMLYISRVIPFLGTGALNFAKTVLSSDIYRDIARAELLAIDHRLAELASGPASNADIPMALPSIGEQLRALVHSISSDPEESMALSGQGTGYPDVAICQYIRERVAQ